MHILYVVSRPIEINTSASLRNRATVLGLVENGNTVDIITTEPDKNHLAYDASLSLCDSVRTQYIQLGGAQKVASYTRKIPFLRALRRIAYRIVTRYSIYDNLYGFVTHTEAISLKEEKYDLIISSSDPKSSHLFVYNLLKEHEEDFKGKWIQIWGDPFASDITVKSQVHKKRIKKEEHNLLLKADKIVYVSPLTLDVQKKAYSDCAEKMKAYPIPYEKETIYNKAAIDENDIINLLYCGDYDHNVRNILPLYNAVKNMSHVHLTICGNSDSPVDSCEQVTVLSRIPYEQVIQQEKRANILIHLSNIFGSQIPGKIYQLSATNKPILFILDGEKDAIHQYFSQYHRFVFAENTSSDITSVLQTMISNIDTTEYLPLKDFDKRHIASCIVSFD